MKDETVQNIQSLQSLRARLPAQLSSLAETMHNHARSHFNNGCSTYDLEYTIWDDGDYRLYLMQPNPGGPERMQVLRYKGSEGCVIYRDSTFNETIITNANKQVIDTNPDAPKRLFDGYDGEDAGRSPL